MLCKWNIGGAYRYSFKVYSVFILEEESKTVAMIYCILQVRSLKW